VLVCGKRCAAGASACGSVAGALPESVVLHAVLKRWFRSSPRAVLAMGGERRTGALLIPFPNILMSTVEQSAVIQRNVAPTAKGRLTIVGALNFSCELRESYLYHDIGFRHWSIALSNGLMAKDFTHGLHGFVSGACCCGGLACCVTSDNSLHPSGWMCRVRVSQCRG